MKALIFLSILFLSTLSYGNQLDFNEVVQIVDKMYGQNTQVMSMNGIESVSYMTADGIDKLVKRLEPFLKKNGFRDVSDDESIIKGRAEALESSKEMGMKFNEIKTFSNKKGNNFSISSLSMSSDSHGLSMKMDMITIQYMDIEKVRNAHMKEPEPTPLDKLLKEIGHTSTE